MINFEHALLDKEISHVDAIKYAWVYSVAYLYRWYRIYQQ